MHVSRLLATTLSVAALCALVPVARAQAAGADTVDAARLPAEIIPRDWLVIEPVDGRGRRPFRPDAVFAAHLLERVAAPPVSGGALTGEHGEERVWTEREADEQGNVGGSRIGWAYTSIHSDNARVMLAELSGASTLFVNADGFVGDMYRAGFGAVPVALRAGTNHVYVNGVRGSFRFRLSTPGRKLILGTHDVTLPDLVAGGENTRYADRAGLLFMNASTEAIPRLQISTQLEGAASAQAAPEPHGLPPLGIAKVPVWVRAEGAPPAGSAGETRALAVSFGGHAGEERAEHEFTLRVVEPSAARRHVFTSAVDRSVQEFSVLPPSRSDDGAEDQNGDDSDDPDVAKEDDEDIDVDDGDGDGEDAESEDAPGARSNEPEHANTRLDAGDTLFERPRLVLTLHGAGVGSLGQVRSYSAKPNTWIVAPTNRRPFGFDWQDWGRLDAYEVLAAALKMTGADPATVGLTGHSMGGHGAWHLAANDPDGFAAVAPSAAWASFDSYTGRPEGELRETWHAADAASQTLELITNLAQLPIFILHGAEDDNVPLSEASAMEAALRSAGAAPRVHTQAGAGHFWNGEQAAGVDCVDWPDLFALLLSRRVPSTPVELDMLTVDPGVDSRHHWISASQPLEYGRPMRLRAEWDATQQRVELRTSNARRIGIRWPGSARPLTLILDGQEFDADALQAADATHAAFRSTGERWFLLTSGLPTIERLDGETGARKTPGRSGPFKRAFDRGFVMVYGTAGSPAEDAELLARARYDAAVWWYRANGRAPVISDTEFLDPLESSRWARHNVILYGNADSNAAWDEVLDARCPIRATRGRMQLGQTRWERDDLGAVFVFPRKGEPGTLVGVFADTGVAGARLGYTLAPFVSGVGYPDYAIFGSEVLQEGDGGVLAAGWLDADWTLNQPPDVLR